MAPKPPASLLRYMREGRCVLFCGSGLSAWAKLPTWKKLLQDIITQLGEEMPDDSDLDELNRLLNAGKLLEIADHCRETLGQRYHNILSEQLRGVTGDIPEPHKIIIELPFSAVVTTNYDKLLERSFASQSNWPKTPTHLDVDMLGPLLFDGSFFILKAHGDIDRPESMVLTTRDYQEIIHANPAFNAIFSAILLTKAILFIGYSLNDPDFRLLFDRQLTVFRGNIPERYALMSGVGKVERDVLWRTARIRVLPYADGKHEEVLEFLRTVSDQLRSAPGAAAKSLQAVTLAPKRGGLAPQPPSPAAASTVLSLRLQGRMLEASVISRGNVVQGSGTPPVGTLLAKLIPDALRWQSKARLFGRMLTECLPDVVLRALKETPADHVITLRLSPDLELLPWEWLIIEGSFLLLRQPVVRASAGVSDTARGYPIVRRPARALLIGDPNQSDGIGLSLPGALAEVKEIAEAYGKHAGVLCKLLLGADASFDNVAGEFASGHYDVVHFAGHAWCDERESFVFLSQEVQLRASELRSLLSPHPPAILFLNSHYTIFMPPGAPGEEANKVGIDAEKPARSGQRGFVGAASAAGVGTLIGSFDGGLDDALARQVGVNFHRQLLKGAPVASALHQALLLSVPKGKNKDRNHLSYAMSGYGDIVLPPTKRQKNAGGK
ncbi:MAG TPA: SIR2 family protein [Candidatus Tectomicrobia bacterium]|nr:SIR2 family protein [Candidatus Tectomicrobia bacterium]